MNFSGKLVIIIALAVTVLLVSNIIATKPLSLFTLPFEVLGDKAVIVSVSVICFPLSYIISDVLTEVYGFRVARGVIWLGFACNLLMVILIWIGGAIPGRRLLGWSGRLDGHSRHNRLGAARQLLRIHRGRVRQRDGHGHSEE